MVGLQFVLVVIGIVAVSFAVDNEICLVTWRMKSGKMISVSGIFSYI